MLGGRGHHDDFKDEIFTGIPSPIQTPQIVQFLLSMFTLAIFLCGPFKLGQVKLRMCILQYPQFGRAKYKGCEANRGKLVGCHGQKKSSREKQGGNFPPLYLWSN